MLTLGSFRAKPPRHHDTVPALVGASKRDCALVEDQLGAPDLRQERQRKRLWHRDLTGWATLILRGMRLADKDQQSITDYFRPPARTTLIVDS